MNIASLRARLVDLSDRATAITNQAEGRSLTDEERAELDAVLNEFDVVEKDLRTAERFTNTVESGRRSSGRRSEPEPINNSQPSTDGPMPRRRSAAPAAGTVASFRDELATMAGDMGGFADARDFLMAVGSGRADPRLSRVQNTQTEGVGSEGGFAVPGALTAAFLGGAVVESGLLSRASLFTTASNTLLVVSPNSLNHTDGKFAGVSLNWVPEGGQISSQTAQLRGINLVCSKGACMVDVSSELLEDSRNADVIVRQVLADATRLALEGAVVAGTGVGQPRGFIGHASTVTVAADAGQVADTLTHSNLVRMVARLHPSSLRNAIWVCSPSALEALYEVAFPVKASNGDIVAGEAAPATYNAASGEFRLMGLPLVVSEAAAALGDVGDVVLADMSQYAVAIRRQVSIAVDVSSKFDYDLVPYRLTVRIAGQPMWSSPVTPAAGPSLSWCVALAGR